ncbi:MAG: hypothetical protein AB3N13_13400 [Arenibacterium sp.]
MIMRALSAGAFVLATSGIAQARFEVETLCNGMLKFPNDDGTSSEYELLILLDAVGYALTSTDQETSETTFDAGECSAYASAGCTHEIEVDGEKTGDSYHFRLQKISATTFAYEEVWADGSVGRTILTCTPDRE